MVYRIVLCTRHVSRDKLELYFASANSTLCRSQWLLLLAKTWTFIQSDSEAITKTTPPLLRNSRAQISSTYTPTSRWPTPTVPPQVTRATYARARTHTAARDAAPSPRRPAARAAAARPHPCQSMVLGAVIGLSKRQPVPRRELLAKEPARALGREDVGGPDARVRARLLHRRCAVRAQEAHAHRGEAREASQEGGGGGPSALAGGARLDEREGAQRGEGAEGVREGGYGGRGARLIGFGVMDDEREGRTAAGRRRARTGDEARSAERGDVCGRRREDERQVEARKRGKACEGRNEAREAYVGDRRRDAQRLDYLRARDVLTAGGDGTARRMSAERPSSANNPSGAPCKMRPAIMSVTEIGHERDL
ncbi:hypothetical protein FB451DRAFT_1452322 [Mycena latifolia]|nr:hypothetical protein FB451DRAFT_1452322 [Mycena latifolia]